MMTHVISIQSNDDHNFELGIAGIKTAIGSICIRHWVRQTGLG